MVDPVQKLKDLFFSKTSAIRYCPGLEGQRVQHDVICIGDRAGPDTNVRNLCHELSHFVEIDDARMRLHGWGLVFPEKEICGQRCVDATTLKMTERELRVMAYQTNLLDDLKVEFDLLKDVRALSFMPDFLLVPMEDGQHPTQSGRPYAEWDPSRYRWLRNRIESLRAEFSLERFHQEWNRKINLLTR